MFKEMRVNLDILQPSDCITPIFGNQDSCVKGSLENFGGALNHYILTQTSQNGIAQRAMLSRQRFRCLDGAFPCLELPCKRTLHMDSSSENSFLAWGFLQRLAVDKKHSFFGGEGGICSPGTPAGARW